MTPTDGELLTEIAQGDHAAFESIYRAHKDRLFTLALWIVRDHQAAEDLIHDVFLRFADASRKLARKPVVIKSYLTAMCANRARDFLRKHRVLNAFGDIAECVDRRQRTPWETCAQFEQARRVTERVGQLPWEQREVIALHIHGDKTFQEIADLTNTSINTIQSRYRYAIAALRQALRTKEPATCTNPPTSNNT